MELSIILTLAGGPIQEVEQKERRANRNAHYGSFAFIDISLIHSPVQRPFVQRVLSSGNMIVTSIPNYPKIPGQLASPLAM